MAAAAPPGHLGAGGGGWDEAAPAPAPAPAPAAAAAAAAAAALLEAGPYEFTAALSLQGGRMLGVDVDWADGRTLYVKSVQPGAVADWNRGRPAEEGVQPGDRIVAVNGYGGDAQVMIGECRSRSTIHLRIRTWREQPARAAQRQKEEGEPPPATVPGVQRAGVYVPGVTPARTVDVLLDLRRAAAAQKLPGVAEPPGGLRRDASSASGGSGPAAPAASPPPTGPRSSEPLDQYAVLGAERGADEIAIKKCYRRLVLQWHPDKHPVKREEAEEKIRLINNAYELLGNPMKRADYDQMLAAIERRRAGVHLETSFIKPRMSIPKEFMLCPLGHPDKFVRVAEQSLRVQARDDGDTRDLDFNEFFQAAKFSLWWLPEVNNMCRLRAQESAGRGVEGGLNLNFMIGGEKGSGAGSDVTLGPGQEPRTTNLLVIASPFSQGAFRFEGAFWPSRHLCFSTPSELRMAAVADAEADIVDFVLVDYSAMFKYMSVDEVLAGAVQSTGSPEEYVKLSDLRADLGVRMYFQNTFGAAVWNNKDFEAFFDGHYERWDFDKARARVRLRPRERRGDAGGIVPEAPKDYTERLLRAERQDDVVQAVLHAGREELAGLPLERFAAALWRLAEAAPASSSSSPEADALTPPEDLGAARRRLLAALPAACKRAAGERGGGGGIALAELLPLHRAAAAVDVVRSTSGGGGAQGEDEGAAPDARGDARLREARTEALRSLGSLAGARLRKEGAAEEADLKRLLPEILALRLEWDDVTDALLSALAPMLAASKKSGTFLEPLRVAARAGREAVAVAEALARHELRLLPFAQGDVAVEVLAAMADGGILVDEVAAALRPPILHRLPFPELVRLVVVLGESSGLDAEALKPALLTRVAVAGPGLAAVPAQELLRLAAVVAKSAVTAECGLGPVASAAAATLGTWPLDDVVELLLIVARSKASVSSAGARKVFVQATEIVLPRLPELNPKRLLKTVLAGSAAEFGLPLLEAAAGVLCGRLAELRPDQLLSLTQEVLRLGGLHPVVTHVLDFWARLLAAAGDGGGQGGQQLGAAPGVPADGEAPTSLALPAPRVRLPGDGLARLAQLLAPAAPGHAAVFAAIGARLAEVVSTLSLGGCASFEAAFPGGAGPSFPGKQQLLKAIGEQRAKMESEKEIEAQAVRKSRSPPRSGQHHRRRSRSQTRSRNRSRSRLHSHSRSRSISCSRSGSRKDNGDCCGTVDADRRRGDIGGRRGGGDSSSSDGMRRRHVDRNGSRRNRSCSRDRDRSRDKGRARVKDRKRKDRRR